MVLPTNRYDPLTAWLNSRKRGCASEYAGIVCLDAFGPIKHLINPRHLTPEVKALFRFSRSAPRTYDAQPNSVHAAREILRKPVTAALSAICEDLNAVGIDAQPNDGLGAISGDEIFACGVRIHNPIRLAEVLGVPYMPGGFD